MRVCGNAARPTNLLLGVVPDFYLQFVFISQIYASETVVSRSSVLFVSRVLLHYDSFNYFNDKMHANQINQCSMMDDQSKSKWPELLMKVVSPKMNESFI